VPLTPPVPELSRLIPLSAHVVLDIGCGHGELGAAYRGLNPNVRLLAIDNNEADVEAARVHYDECIVADAGTGVLPFETPDGIDCIVYDAVLAHVPDPFAMLRRHAEALSPDGMMLICVSNPEHWRLAERLLRGASRDEETGLPSWGSERWFSRETLPRRLSELGLVPVDVRPHIVDEPAGRAFIEAITPALLNLGIDPADYARNALPFQYIWISGESDGRRFAA
jgi:SAM-dependent methyltransferase